MELREVPCQPGWCRARALPADDGAGCARACRGHRGEPSALTRAPGRRRQWNRYRAHLAVSAAAEAEPTHTVVAVIAVWASFSRYDPAMSPLSGVLGESWQLYRRYARHLLTIAFVVFLIAAIVSAALSLVGGIVGGLLSSLVMIVAEFLLLAALVKAVQDVRDGRVDLSVGQTLEAAVPLIGSVAVAAILAGIAITVGFAIFIIPGLFLLTIWCLIVPAIVLGGTGPFDSFGRSWQLVKSHFWN